MHMFCKLVDQHLGLLQCDQLGQVIYCLKWKYWGFMSNSQDLSEGNDWPMLGRNEPMQRVHDPSTCCYYLQSVLTFDQTLNHSWDFNTTLDDSDLWNKEETQVSFPRIIKTLHQPWTQLLFQFVLPCTLLVTQAWTQNEINTKSSAVASVETTTWWLHKDSYKIQEETVENIFSCVFNWCRAI